LQYRWTDANGDSFIRYESECWISGLTKESLPAFSTLLLIQRHQRRHDLIRFGRTTGGAPDRRGVAAPSSKSPPGNSEKYFVTSRGWPWRDSTSKQSVSFFFEHALSITRTGSYLRTVWYDCLSKFQFTGPSRTGFVPYLRMIVVCPSFNLRALHVQVNATFISPV